MDITNNSEIYRLYCYDNNISKVDLYNQDLSEFYYYPEEDDDIKNKWNINLDINNKLLLLKTNNNAEESPSDDELNVIILHLDNPYNLSLVNEGDYQYFKFTPSVSGLYNFISEGTNDSYVSAVLYDEELEYIDKSYIYLDENEAEHFFIECNLLRNHDYYFRVDAEDNNINTVIRIRKEDGDKEVSKLEILQKPYRTVLMREFMADITSSKGKEGDYAFEPEGLILKVTYDDGTQEEIPYGDTSGIQVEETDAGESGIYFTKVIFTYGGVSVSMPIDLRSVKDNVDGEFVAGKSTAVNISSKGKMKYYKFEPKTTGTYTFTIDEKDNATISLNLSNGSNIGSSYIDDHIIQRNFEAGKSYYFMTCYQDIEKTGTFSVKVMAGKNESATTECQHKNTEIRGAREATETLNGYTGDTYCLDCSKKLKTGQIINKLGNGSNTNNTNNQGGTSQNGSSGSGTRTNNSSNSSTNVNTGSSNSGKASNSIVQIPDNNTSNNNQSYNVQPINNTPIVTTDQTWAQTSISPVNTKITDSENKSIYRITSSGDNGGTVEYVKPSSSSASKVIVPSALIIDGKIYKVTSIAAKAFKNNKKLKQIDIGKNIKKIGKQAFYNCKKLNKLVIRSKKLTNKNVGSNTFKGVNKNVRVFVPESKINSYMKLLKKKGLKKDW